FDEQKREAAAPNGIVGDVAVALAGALIDLGRLHVIFGSNPVLGDAEEAGVGQERVDKLVLDIALGDEILWVGDRRLDPLVWLKLGNQTRDTPSERSVIPALDSGESSAERSTLYERFAARCCGTARRLER